MVQEDWLYRSVKKMTNVEDLPTNIHGTGPIQNKAWQDAGFGSKKEWKHAGKPAYGTRIDAPPTPKPISIDPQPKPITDSNGGINIVPKPISLEGGPTKEYPIDMVNVGSVGTLTNFTKQYGYGNDIAESVPVFDSADGGGFQIPGIPGSKGKGGAPVRGPMPPILLDPFDPLPTDTPPDQTTHPPSNNVVPYVPPTQGSGGDLTSIAGIYGSLFPGGGTDSIPAPTEQGPVLLYPVTYQKEAAPAQKQTSPLIFILLAGVILGGYFLYKRFAKK